jgi:hypothetical protein
MSGRSVQYLCHGRSVRGIVGNGSSSKSTDDYPTVVLWRAIVSRSGTGVGPDISEAVMSAPFGLSFSPRSKLSARQLRTQSPLSAIFSQPSTPPPAQLQPVQAVTNSSTQGAASGGYRPTHPRGPPRTLGVGACRAGSLWACARCLPPCSFVHTAPPPLSSSTVHAI